MVLGLSLITEGYSWLRALRQTRAEARREKLGYLDYVRQSRDPNVKMVLFEDSAALIGIALQAITGVEFWDPLASVAIGAMLIVVAFWMARDARYMLVGASALPDERARLEAALNSFPEIDEVDAKLHEVVDFKPSPGETPHLNHGAQAYRRVWQLCPEESAPTAPRRDARGRSSRRGRRG